MCLLKTAKLKGLNNQWYYVCPKIFWVILSLREREDFFLKQGLLEQDRTCCLKNSAIWLFTKINLEEKREHSLTHKNACQFLEFHPKRQKMLICLMLATSPNSEHSFCHWVKVQSSMSRVEINTEWSFPSNGIFSWPELSKYTNDASSGIIKRNQNQQSEMRSQHRFDFHHKCQVLHIMSDYANGSGIWKTYPTPPKDNFKTISFFYLKK